MKFPVCTNVARATICMIGETAGADRNDAGFPILFVFSCQASQIAVHTAVIEAVRVADDQAGFR